MFKPKLKNLNAGVTGYTLRMHGDQYYKPEEKWVIGKKESTVKFSSNDDFQAFKKQYDFYLKILVSQKHCISRRSVSEVSRVIDRLMDRRLDICVRIIEPNVAQIVGTQHVIDEEAAGFERDILDLEDDGEQKYPQLEDKPTTSEEMDWEQVPSKQEQDEYRCCTSATPQSPPAIDKKYPTSDMDYSVFVRRINLKTCEVQVYPADLCRLDVDAIVCPIKNSEHHLDGLAAQIAAAANEEFLNVIKRVPLPKKKDRFTTPTGCGLPCKHIILVNGRFKHSMKSKDVQECVSVALEAAKSRASIASIAIPLLGTGGCRMPVKDSVTGIMKAIKDDVKEEDRLKHIHIVGSEGKMTEALDIATSVAKEKTWKERLHLS